MNDLRRLLKDAFGFDDFRPHQEGACSAATEGEDVLVVMPTGAGKTLTFQLPGLARRRSGPPSRVSATVVISPLIALMNDQVEKLKRLGLRAETINSAMVTDDQRKIARAYNRGELDFLYISPERLAMRGVPEWLGRRPPSLIAVDEAHCISHWGHDFRPEYRLMAKRLPVVCGGADVPIVAVTATATPVVQEDILEQLGVRARARRFVHGFRRVNLAVEVLDVAPNARSVATMKVLKGHGRLPAIVYVRLRAAAEEVAFELREAGFVARPFHAGLHPSVKKKTQDDFTSGLIDVVVATIAFGMGVDKPDVRTVVHASVPDSIESYYQEIGRAGRDGAESSVVLFYSAADERQHEWFFKQDYPEPEILQAAYGALAEEPERFEQVQERTTLHARAFGAAIEKLRTHGGAVVEGFDADQRLARGDGAWRETYVAQRTKKKQDLDEMVAYAARRLDADGACRMTELVRYFGDQEGGERRDCGLCDACLARRGEHGAAWTSGASDPDEDELKLIEDVLVFLAQHDGQTYGNLYKGVLQNEDGGFNKDQKAFFEHAMGTLERDGRVRLAEYQFPKDGGKVKYTRVYLAGDEVKRKAPTPKRRRERSA